MAYSRRVLFDSLSFGSTEWAKARDDELRADSGLRLLPRDLLKLGQLVLAGGGVWDGHQIVPPEWMARITAPVVAIDPSRS